MGRAELLILAAAVVIFGVFTLSLMDMQISVTQENVKNKIENYLLDEAKSYLEKLEMYKFDQVLNNDNSVPTGVTIPDDFTPADSLFIEPADSGAANDIDDFAMLSGSEKVSIDTFMFLEDYQIDCRVKYVDENLDSSGTPTVRKLFQVVLTHPNLNNEITYSRVFTFY